MSPHLDRARNLVLEWVRASHRDPSFLAGQTGLDQRHEEIAKHFLKWAKEGGFEYRVVKIGNDGTAAYEVQWTHRGYSFVGFKQPAPEAAAENALLAGCAALLGNDWCRERLPK